MIYIPENVNWVFDPNARLYIPVNNQFAQGHCPLYLSEDVVTDHPIRTAPLITEEPSTIVTEFDDFDLFEEANYNLIESGSRWFSSKMTPGSSLTNL